MPRDTNDRRASETAGELARRHGLRLSYDVELDRLGRLGADFVRLGPDEGLLRYFEHAEAKRHGLFTTWLHRGLRTFLSDFDINGYLGTYPMHVLSSAQFRELLGPLAGGHLLDVGAGRGDVTRAIADCFDQVTVTETSKAMARRLRKEGFEVIEGDVALVGPGRTFDAVSLLNVLDRCDRPLSLLGSVRTVLRAGGVLVIALVLPYRPFVYEGSASRPPSERLPIRSDTFEEAAVELFSFALAALGFELVAVSRAPYLSGGDAERPLYELDDLLLVLRAVGEPPPILGSLRTK